MDDTQRAVFRRETLLKKLSAVVAKLPQLNLPATIKAIYAFGGVLREKERLHDIDIICLYVQTPEHSQRWNQFWENFSTHGFHSERSPIHELRGLLEPYYERGVPLDRAVKSPELSEALAAKGVEPQWAGCFSWTDIMNNPIGFFFPSIEKVLKKLLLKGVKGLSFVFLPYDQFMQGKSGYSHLNTVLVWSPESPDIKANLFGRTAEEKREFALQELRKFLNIISESKIKFRELKTELIKGPVKLNFDALENSHMEICDDAGFSYDELLNRCEQARNEMRRYDEEVELLGTIKAAVSRLAEDKDEQKLENPMEEQIAWLTLLWQPKYKVREKRIRELLHILGLPEDKVKTLKSLGSKTDYELINMRFRASNQK